MSEDRPPGYPMPRKQSDQNIPVVERREKLQTSAQPSSGNEPKPDAARQQDLLAERLHELGLDPGSLSPDTHAAIVNIEPGRLGQEISPEAIDAAQRALAHQALAIQALSLLSRPQPPLPKLD